MQMLSFASGNQQQSKQTHTHTPTPHTHHFMACSIWEESQGSSTQTSVGAYPLPQSSSSKHDGQEPLHLLGLIPMKEIFMWNVRICQIL